MRFIDGRRAPVRVLTAAALLLLCIAFAACGDDDSTTTGGGNATSGSSADGGGVLEKAKQDGKVKVGFANEVPYDYIDDDGKLTGESPEVTRAVMKELDVPEIEGVLTKFDTLIPGLLAGRFDIISGSMNIKPDRCAEVIFSEPDFLQTVAFGVKKGNPKNITSYKTIADSGSSVGVIAGTTDLQYAEDNGVKDVKQFPDQASLIDALRVGRIDAAAVSSVSLKIALDQDGNEGLEATPAFFPEVNGKQIVQGTGFAFRKEDTALRDAFNEKLQAMKKDGRLVKLLAPFGIPAKDIEASSQVTEKQLCSGEDIKVEGY